MELKLNNQQRLVFISGQSARHCEPRNHHPKQNFLWRSNLRREKLCLQIASREISYETTLSTTARNDVPASCGSIHTTITNILPIKPGQFSILN